MTPVTLPATESLESNLTPEFISHAEFPCCVPASGFVSAFQQKQLGHFQELKDFFLKLYFVI